MPSVRKDKVQATCASCTVFRSALAVCLIAYRLIIEPRFNMQLRFISCLLLLAAGLVIATDVDELKIETMYAPSECALKAQKGDSLKVHYVSSKLSSTT